MTEDQKRLLELYDAELCTYRAYVRELRGEALVTGQRISEVRVEQARTEWTGRLRDLREAGGTSEVLSPLLRERTEARRTVRRAS